MLHAARPAVALAVVAAAALSFPAAGRAQAEEQLAQRYSPVVRLVEQKEECGPGEPYEPTDIDAFMGQDTVSLRGPWTSNDLIKIASTAADLGKGLFDYNLDFPGDALDPGCDYERWARRINEGRRPAVYAHVVAESGHPDRLALQYWLSHAGCGSRSDRSIRERASRPGVDRGGGVELRGAPGPPPTHGRGSGRRRAGSRGDGLLLRRPQRLVEPRGDAAVRHRRGRANGRVRPSGARCGHGRAHRVRDRLRGDGAVARRAHGARCAGAELRPRRDVPKAAPEPRHGRGARDHDRGGAPELAR